MAKKAAKVITAFSCKGGTGKTTIINEIFKDNIIKNFEYDDNSVLDNKKSSAK